GAHRYAAAQALRQGQRAGVLGMNMPDCGMLDGDDFGAIVKSTKGSVMENQHRHITGYRELSEAEIALINKAKGIAEQVHALIEECHKTEGLDQRWIATAKTDLQKGFMALVRSIAKPTSF